MHTGLEHLDYSQQQLGCWPTDLPPLNRIASLQLHDTALRSIPADAATALTKLKSLDVSKNRLEWLPAEIGMMGNLQCLNVNNNNLKAIPDSLSCCTMLQVG